MVQMPKNINNYFFDEIHSLIIMIIKKDDLVQQADKYMMCNMACLQLY